MCGTFTVACFKINTEWVRFDCITRLPVRHAHPGSKLRFVFGPAVFQFKKKTIFVGQLICSQKAKFIN